MKKHIIFFLLGFLFLVIGIVNHTYWLAIVSAIVMYIAAVMIYFYCKTKLKAKIYSDTINKEANRQKENNYYDNKKISKEKHKNEDVESAIKRIPHIGALVSTDPVNSSDIDVIDDIEPLNVTSTTNVADLFPLCVIDVETTGLNKLKDKIIQVSIIKYDAVFKPIEMIDQYVNPNINIPEEIVDMTNITNEFASEFPTIEYLADGISDFIRGCNIAGHNVNFDVGFLSAAGVRFDDNTKYIDSLAMCRKMYRSYKTERFKHKSNNFQYDVENYKLDTMLEFYNIRRYVSHQSDSDAYCTGLLLERLFEDMVDS